MKAPSGDEIMATATMTIRFSGGCYWRMKVATWLIKIANAFAPFEVVIS